MRALFEGRREFLDAFERLCFEPHTTNTRHLMPELSSIDHLGIFPGWMTWGEPLVCREPGADFPSDNALYAVKGV